MAQQRERTWEHESLAHAIAQGRAEGRLEASRSILRGILKDRFGVLPEAILQQIESIQEVYRLQTAACRAARIQSLDELQGVLVAGSALEQEIQAIMEQVERTWEQELLAQGMAQGKVEGTAEGLLRARKDSLRELLEDRFGALPETLLQRIESVEAIERLRAAIR